MHVIRLRAPPPLPSPTKLWGISVVLTLVSLTYQLQYLFLPSEETVDYPLIMTDNSASYTLDNDNSPKQKDAIAMIAFANATKTRLVERCIRSIRSRGQWDSWIVIITDNKGRYDTLQQEDDHIIVLYPLQRDWEEIPDAELKVVKMKYKRFKTLIPEYMDLDRRLVDVERILYLDVDIVVCQPLASWVEEKWTKSYSKRNHLQDHATSYMFMFQPNQGNRAGKVAHSGVLLLDRQDSKPCVSYWRELMDGGRSRYARDQTVLRVMMKRGAAQTHCEIIVWKKNDKELVFPLEEDFLTRSFSRFVHITNTHHVSQTDASIQQAFLEEALEMTEEERNSNLSLAKTVEIF
jgi:hypothetical protein